MSGRTGSAGAALGKASGGLCSGQGPGVTGSVYVHVWGLPRGWTEAGVALCCPPLTSKCPEASCACPLGLAAEK